MQEWQQQQVCTDDWLLERAEWLARNQKSKDAREIAEPAIYEIANRSGIDPEIIRALRPRVQAALMWLTTRMPT